MRVATLATGMVLALTACGVGTGISAGDLDGVWDAVVLEFSNPDSADQVVEAINLGASLTLTFRSDGTYTLETSFPGEPDETDTGTFVVVGSILTLDPGSGNAFDAAIARTGDRLALESNDAEFDWNDDGVEDPAFLRVALQRRQG